METPAPTAFPPPMTIPYESCYAPRAGLWVLTFRGVACEVLAGGGPGAPDPGRAELAAWAVERLDTLFDRARSYLDHYVDRARLGGTGWSPLALEVGLRAGEPPDELEVMLVMDGGDDPGEWRVRIRRAPLDVTGFFAHGFGYRFI
jgi:hypothetical protein